MINLKDWLIVVNRRDESVYTCLSGDKEYLLEEDDRLEFYEFDNFEVNVYLPWASNRDAKANCLISVMEGKLEDANLHNMTALPRMLLDEFCSDGSNLEKLPIAEKIYAVFTTLV